MELAATEAVMVKGKALRQADDLVHERSWLGCGGGC
jgi:hypothetical protein